MKITFKNTKSYLEIQAIKEKVQRKPKNYIYLIKDKSVDELCEIVNELDSYIWDENKLGKFKSNDFAIEMLYYLRNKVGYYKPLKYYHLTMQKESAVFCKTDEEFKEYILELMYNERFN